MSGKKGMLRIKTDQNSGRSRMWRIMRRRLVFTIDDLVIPLDGVTSANAWKFVANLMRHGIVKFDRWSGKSGMPGCCKVYRLVYNPGPAQPVICPTCKKSLTATSCGGDS